MKNKISRILQTVIILIFSFHLFCTIVYLSPPNYLKVKIGSFVSGYMTDFFYQDWHLFSPNPGFDTLKLWVNCDTEADPSGWFNPMESVLNAHYSNRFNGMGKLLYVYNNLASEIYSTYQKEIVSCERDSQTGCHFPEISSRVVKSKPYALAKRYADEVCKYKSDSSYSRIKIVKFMPKRYSDRNLPAPWGSVTELEFNEPTTNSARNMQ